MRIKVGTWKRLLPEFKKKLLKVYASKNKINGVG